MSNYFLFVTSFFKFKIGRGISIKVKLYFIRKKDNIEQIIGNKKIVLRLHLDIK